MSVLKAAKAVIRRWEASACDRVLGIDTISPLETRAILSIRPSDSYRYEANSYSVLTIMLNHLALKPSDVVYDIGCGAGRILCLAARRNVSAVVGIECVPSLADKARENARVLRARRARVLIISGDAAVQNYSGGSVFIMFNPFGADTMRRVLGRIRTSLALGKSARFAYLNPVHETVLQHCGWLRCARRWRSTWCNTQISYWCSLTTQSAHNALVPMHTGTCPRLEPE